MKGMRCTWADFPAGLLACLLGFEPVAVAPAATVDEPQAPLPRRVVVVSWHVAVAQSTIRRQLAPVPTDCRKKKGRFGEWTD